jgi:predicted TIM-barrel fold metal-dependent hydrolase
MIDYWCNAFTPDRAALWRAVIVEGGLSIRTRDGDDTDGFAEPAAMLERMDRLGVTAVVLPVCALTPDAPLDDFAHYAARFAEIRELSSAHPGRFFGVCSVVPGGGAQEAERAAAALAESWCLGLHTHTHSWGRAFDHADYRPYYELCAEHEVPFVMQAGASGGDFAHESGHPSAIVGPATAFPTVSFVLSHTGAPWVDETIVVATEHPNVHIGTATHPPRRWPAELVAFIRGAGRHKTLFGTGFPLTGHARSLAQLDELDLEPSTRQDLLVGTARRIFGRIPDRP